MASSSSSSSDDHNRFSYFRSRAEDELLSALNNIAGVKELVIDSDLFRQIDRITGVQKLRSIGVKKIMRLEPTLSAPNYIRVYFIRPLLPSLKCVIQLIQSDPRSSFEKSHILCVPRVQFLVKHLIECEDLLDNVVLASLPSWEVIYLDSDLLSMEAEYLFATTYVSNDYSMLSIIASSLVNIQSVLGRIPYVYAIGDKSKRVNDLMDTLIGAMTDNDQAKLTSTQNALIQTAGGGFHSRKLNSSNKQIGHLVIADRSIDFVTPFLSQMVYEGLLDEVFGINAGVMKVANVIVNMEPKDKETMLIMSGETDRVFGTLRYVHLTNLFGQIKAYAEQLRDEMNRQKARIRDESVAELRNLVKQELKDFFDRERMLQRHLAMAEFIMKAKKQEDFKDQLMLESKILKRDNYAYCLETIYQYIHRARHWTRSLQLACLLSACFDGILTSDFEQLRALYLSTYGYDKLTHRISDFRTRCHVEPLLLNLEKAGILKRQSSKRTFEQWSRMLDLFSNQENKPIQQHQLKPTGSSTVAAAAAAVSLRGSVSSSVFDGIYAPLLARLIEAVIFNPDGLDQVEREFNVLQLNAQAKRNRKRVLTDALQGKEPSEMERNILVVFIGGCTHSEINALRLVGAARGYNMNFLTTSVFNFERLLQNIDGALSIT